jgi:hypothetical protein
MQMLDQVKGNVSVGGVLEFCEFLGKDAAHFVLKLFRLLIAESELNLLKERCGMR